MLNATPPTGKKLFFRPEDIQVTNSYEPHVNAIIRDIHYWGSYHTIEVSVREELIIMQVNKPCFEKGSIITVAISQESMWYI